MGYINYSRPGGIHRGVLLSCRGKAKCSKGANKMTLQPPLDGLTDYQPSERTRLVLALAELRKEWQAAVKGATLLQVEVPVGLLFNDIANRLQLSPQERHVFLGGELASDVDSFLDTRVAKKLPN